MRVAIWLLLTFANQSFAGDKFGVFQPQVDSFIVVAKQQGIRINNINILNIALADKLPKGCIGICWGMGTNMPMIFVDATIWSKYSKLQKEEVIWHEMGHCVLGRGHLERIKLDGHPVSIMYPDATLVDNESYYIKHKQEYIEELFHPGRY